MKSISKQLQVFIILSLTFPPLIDLTIGFLYSAGEVACAHLQQRVDKTG
jgi:hypothetical protein